MKEKYTNQPTKRRRKRPSRRALRGPTRAGQRKYYESQKEGERWRGGKTSCRNNDRKLATFDDKTSIYTSKKFNKFHKDFTPRHITVKLLKAKTERILKASEKKDPLHTQILFVSEITGQPMQIAKRDCQPLTVQPNYPSRRKEKRSYSQINKKQFITSRPDLQATLKGTPQAERKGLQPPTRCTGGITHRSLSLRRCARETV